MSLAAGSTESGGVGGLFLWLGLLIVIVLVAGAAVMAYRRRLLSQDTDASDGSWLGSLRAMRDAGRITEEEYQQAKRSIAARAVGREIGAADGD